MIKKIRIQNCFRHADTTLDFQQGLTGIFGANEAGKSLIFEMISYALFGSTALRGSAGDYKKLIVTLDFEVSGVPYQVYRAGTKALLTRNGVELATGQKPINSEIVRILGYDYKVFCVANYSPQGELCNLSRMKPAERKSMVDNVIGLGIIDKVIESIVGQMRDLNSKIQGMNAALIEPVAPERPANYRPQVEIQKELTVMTERMNRFNFVHGWLMLPQKQQPAEVVRPNLPEREYIDAQLSVIRENQSKIRELQAKLSTYAPVTHTKEQLLQLKSDWMKIHRRNELQAELAKFVSEPPFTKEQLDAWTIQAREAQRWATKKQLEAHGKNECPKCQHQWFLQANQLEQFADATETLPPAKIPTLTDYNLLSTYEAQKEQRSRILLEKQELDSVALPELSLSQIEHQLASVDKQTEMEEISSQLKALKVWEQTPQPDYSKMLSDWQAYDYAVSKYAVELDAYNAWVAEYAKLYHEYQSLTPVPAQYQALQQELQQTLIFDSNWTTYTKAHQIWVAQSEKVNEFRFELVEMEKAREAMRGLRISVKKFLVPSLNKVASHLLTQMTGGARTVIEISDEFEITVDGQALNTLSGSGQAVANLAIRIALGQVLIAKKFSIFMADEIDGDMDEERAGYTAECLRRITRHVPQFLLISHKRPLADNYIELGGKSV